MPSRDIYGYSSSSSSSRSSSSDALARELAGLSINSKKAPSYEPKYSSRLAPREPERKHNSSKYETTLITPDTSQSRSSKANYGKPIISDERKQLKDERRSKTSDSRYYANSFMDDGSKYYPSSSKNDSRFYPDSAYYRERR